MDKKAKKVDLSPVEKIKLVAERLEKLWHLVKPLDHDIVIYRGIKRGTIGQNLITNECIKTRLYDLNMHRFCDNADLRDIQLFQNEL